MPRSCVAHHRAKEGKAMLGRIAASLALAVIVAALWAGGPAEGQVGGDPVLVGAGTLPPVRNTGGQIEATARLLAQPAGHRCHGRYLRRQRLPQGHSGRLRRVLRSLLGPAVSRSAPGPAQATTSTRRLAPQDTSTTSGCSGWRSQRRILLLRPGKLACDLAEL